MPWALSLPCTATCDAAALTALTPVHDAADDDQLNDASTQSSSSSAGVGLGVMSAIPVRQQQ